MSVLDDLKYIHERDDSDAIGIAEKQWQQYKHKYGFNWESKEQISSVIFAGMGGSGLAAKAVKNWPELSVMSEVVQVYDLPTYASKSTLLICSSYSGNTEETLSVLSQALDRTATTRPQIIVVSSGGELIKIANEKKLPYIELPVGYQPRMTFGFQLRALLEIFVESNLTNAKMSELEEAADWLKVKINEWAPTLSEKGNLAKRLALDCVGKSVVVYAGPKLSPAAYKWKISFNENAKNVAWFNQFPEFNHNEFLGWTSQPVNKPYTVIELRSTLENTQVQKRFTISERLLSGRRPSPEVVDAQGDSLLKQLMWSIALGDFVSLYLALLNNLDPTPVVLIERLKEELK